jgi:four helix bundle protein
VTGFHASEVAMHIASSVRPVVEAIRRHDADLADQIYRAAKSLCLNAAEGGRRGGKDRGYHFRIAAGSTAELMAGVRFAVAWGICAPQPELFALIDRELAMLWRLDPSHPPRGVARPPRSESGTATGTDTATDTDSARFGSVRNQCLKRW